ncbi:MAG: hypothetical protein Q4C99_01730 [Clostridia bacterium]|nr:hypothetical protein [Clostridia bacterium]
MNTKSKGSNLIFRLLSLLLVFTLASAYLLSGVAAKYTSHSGGADNARVASFNVTQSGTATADIALDIKPGDTVQYEVAVTSNSEVALSYTIGVENKYNNLPLEFKMLDENNNEINSDTIMYSDSKTHNYKLQIAWPSNEDDVSYSGKVDLLVVTLDASQVD